MSESEPAAGDSPQEREGGAAPPAAGGDPEGGGSQRPAPPLRPGDHAPTGQLHAPPSDRYRAPSAVGDPDAAALDGASRSRGLAFGIGVALFVGLVMVLLGSVLGFTAGLLVVAFFLGQLTAVGVRVGAGRTLGQSGRAWVSVGIALAVLVLAQLGLWLWARAEGGTLDPVEYAREVFGPLVAVEAVFAAVGAWWGSR